MTWHITGLFAQESVPSVKKGFLEAKYCVLHEMVNFVLGVDEMKRLCIRGCCLVKTNS